MRKHVLSIIGYLVTTFAVQAVSHFVMNVDHYAAVGHMRSDPIFPLGLFSMLVQGTVMSFLFSKIDVSERTILGALRFSWLCGTILVSYIALAEAAKYTVPSVVSWIAVEGIVGFVQFTLFGVILGLAHKKPSTADAPLRFLRESM